VGPLGRTFGPDPFGELARRVGSGRFAPPPPPTPPTAADVLVEEGVRELLLEALDPRRPPSSHGGRLRGGCHSALRQVWLSFTNPAWLLTCRLGGGEGGWGRGDQRSLLALLEGEGVGRGRGRLLMDLLRKGFRSGRLRLGWEPSVSPLGHLLTNLRLDPLDR